MNPKYDMVDAFRKADNTGYIVMTDNRQVSWKQQENKNWELFTRDNKNNWHSEGVVSSLSILSVIDKRPLFVIVTKIQWENMR